MEVFTRFWYDKWYGGWCKNRNGWWYSGYYCWNCNRGVTVGVVGGLTAKYISGLSTGGTISNGGLFIVGEKGPELVNLPAGSAVYNNQQTRSMMGEAQSMFM